MPVTELRSIGDRGDTAGPAVAGDVASPTVAARVYANYDPRTMIAGTGQLTRNGAVRELMDGSGARAICQELDDWWRVRGYPEVKHEPKPLGIIRGHTTFGVRSNLHNGLPPSLTGAPVGGAESDV